MKGLIDKILERLEREIAGKPTTDEYNNGINRAYSIVQEVAEEYNDGWISCSERLPEEYGDYLVWWTDITRKQYYEIVEYEPNNGWIGEIPQAVEGIYSVIAWQPLPEPFKERD